MRTCSSETDPISSLLLLISLWCRKGLFTPASVLQEERDDRGGVTRPVCNEKTSFVGAEAPLLTWVILKIVSSFLFVLMWLKVHRI